MFTHISHASFTLLTFFQDRETEPRFNQGGRGGFGGGPRGGFGGGYGGPRGGFGGGYGGGYGGGPMGGQMGGRSQIFVSNVRTPISVTSSHH